MPRTFRAASAALSSIAFAFALCALPALSDAAKPAAASAPAVVAWGGLAPWNQLADSVEAFAAKLDIPLGGAAPLRDTAFAQVEAAAAGFGFRRLDFLDRTRPIRFFHQDEAKQKELDGFVLLLPITSEGALLGAVSEAWNREREGHALAQTMPDNRTVFIDVAAGHAVVTFTAGRFARARAFASGPFATQPIPGLMLLGVSPQSLPPARMKALEKRIGELGQSKGGSKSQRAALRGTRDTARRWIKELGVAELFLGVDGDDVRLGTRLRGRKGTSLDKVLMAGKPAQDLANLLPAGSWLAVAARHDPAAALASIDADWLTFEQLLDLQAPDRGRFKPDYEALARSGTGEAALALYRDGDFAPGMLAFIGVKNPPAAVDALCRLVGRSALKLIDSKGKGKGNKGGGGDPDDPKTRILTGLDKGALEPLFAELAALPPELGLAVTRRSEIVDDGTCQLAVIDLDWTKLGKGAKEADRLRALVGKRVELGACTLARLVVVGAGPSLVAHARRIARRDPGGLGADATFASTLARGVARASAILHIQASKALDIFGIALSDADRTQWSDTVHIARTVSATAGQEGAGTEYRLVVPTALIAGIVKLSRGVSNGSGGGGGDEPGATYPAPAAP